MATIETHIKTVTEVSKNSGDFTIHCFSDKKADDTTTPSVFKAQILQEPMDIDNVSGKEGELMLSYEGERCGHLVNGELIIDPDNDDVNKYNRGGTDNTDLIYTE